MARPRGRRTTRSTPSTGPATGPSRSTVEEDRIVIRRAGDDATSDDDEATDAGATRPRPSTGEDGLAAGSGDGTASRSASRSSASRPVVDGCARLGGRSRATSSRPCYIEGTSWCLDVAVATVARRRRTHADRRSPTTRSARDVRAAALAGRRRSPLPLRQCRRAIGGHAEA